MALTPAQLEQRRSFLGGTDIAAIAGLNPPSWNQPIDVFADKRPDVVPPRVRKASPLMDLGHLFEDPVARMFQAETGLRVHRPPKAEPVHCRDHPWEGGFVDRLVAHSGPLDCKMVFYHGDEWGDSDPEGANPVVPVRYLVQVLWYMHVTRREPGWLAARLPTRLGVYRINPNPELLASLVALGERFWHDHVVPGVAPEPDGSGSYDQFLRRLHPKDEVVERVATPYEQTLLRDYRTALQAETNSAAELERTKQALMASMGDTGTLIAPGARVTWRFRKGWLKTDWKRVAEAVSPEDELLKSVIPLHSTLTEGTRPFQVKFDDEDEPMG